jgi:hypothetical protein
MKPIEGQHDSDTVPVRMPSTTAGHAPRSAMLLCSTYLRAAQSCCATTGFNALNHAVLQGITPAMEGDLLGETDSLNCVAAQRLSRAPNRYCDNNIGDGDHSQRYTPMGYGPKYVLPPRLKAQRLHITSSLYHPLYHDALTCGYAPPANT